MWSSQWREDLEREDKQRYVSKVTDAKEHVVKPFCKKQECNGRDWGGFLELSDISLSRVGKEVC